MASSFPIPVRALVFSVAATLGSGFASGPALAGASGPFLAHQALYELKLVKARGSNAINGARGRILYNFSGSACEGYTSEFRQVSELDSGEGKLTPERSALALLGRRRRQELSLQDRYQDERCRFRADRRHGRARRRPHHGQAEAAGGEDVQSRRQDRVSDRADPAHHRRGARGQIGAGADGL